MKLESVAIKGFRSIKSVTLTECGNFNVLIGKNNSGKSSILAAIQVFFTCIREGSVANLNPPIGKDIDFFGRETKEPIEITLVFALTLAERDNLIRDIVIEAPQMKNAVDGIHPSLLLAITVKIMAGDNPYTYISSVSLIEPNKSISNSAQERSLFSVNYDTATEMVSQLSRSRRQVKDADALSSLTRLAGNEEWRRLITRTNSSEKIPSSFLASFTRDLDRDLRNKVDDLLRDTPLIDDFFREILALAAKMQDEAKTITEEPLKYKVGTFAGDEVSVPQYISNLLRTLSEMSVLNLTERRKDIGKEEAERILSLKTVRGQEGILRSLKETVSSLLGVQIDAFQGQVSPDSGQRIAELDIDNFLVEVNGSGIREALRLILDYEFAHPSILLVEEPETHLHPALETSMMRYLKQISASCQVFITTHSTNFLDTAEMRNVYLVSKDTFTQVQLLNLADAETQIPRELGIRLSSLFMFDRLVFVEGGSDEEIIREWATILDVNLGQANVGFIAMGGVRNFAHFAAETTLSFLTKRRVQVWFIIDRDERDDSDIARMQQILGGKASIRALAKREIENYLISPQAIKKFIQLKKHMAGDLSETNSPDEEAIKAAIDEIAESLKQFAIDKRVAKLVCRPVYPLLQHIFDEKSSLSSKDRMSSELERMKREVEEAQSTLFAQYIEQAEALETIWQKDKLAIVPGDILLDRVCQKYGVRFLKERDGGRLAALMDASDINGDIKSIITDIGRT